MSTQILRRPWSGRRSLAGAAVIALLVFTSPFALGTASGSYLAHHAAPKAAPSSATGCGASGTIADKSGFEDADGNLVIDHAGCMDWNGFAPVTWTGNAPYQFAAKTTGAYSFYGASDAVNAHDDTSYAGGTKQNQDCPATKTGNVPNKDDLARIYVAGSIDPATGHVYLDLAWVRGPLNTTRSDAHISFEFNQGTTPCGQGSPLVHRTVGDMLFNYDFQQGSATIGFSTWTGSDWSQEVTLPSNLAEAKVFTGSGTVFDALKPAGSPDPAAGEFGEAGVDLTAIVSNLHPNGRPCEAFGSVIGQSRASGSSTSAQLKDLVGPVPVNLSNCATPSLTTTQQPASGSVGDTFKDTAHLSGAAPLDGTGSITFKLYGAQDCHGPVLDTETVPGISANGDYTTPTGFQIQNAGTYYWVASFSGDGHNNAAHSGCDDEPVVVKAPQIKIVKTPDAAQVSAGDPIGFTLTVYNAGGGDAKGVTLSDPLPTNAGLSWTIDAQGSGWNNTCAIANGTLTCGPVTVPAGTTQAGSTFTVHITSPTTAATGGDCPGSGEVDNTGTVTTTNGGGDQSGASTCVAKPSIQIVKTADAAQVSAGDPIGFTITVYNTGAGNAKGVTLSDVLPTNAGLSWTIDAQGSGWNNTCAIASGTLTCGPVTVPGNTTQGGSTFTVHITSPTTAATGGDCPSTGVVSNTAGVTTTNDGSGQSSASTCVAKPDIEILKTADAAQVNAGDPIGFIITVWNSGTGDAKGVTLSDILPTNAGLNWKIDSQGAGWNGTCAINSGTLSCGPVTVPFGTTQIGSSFTVHITSTTTAATGGVCPAGSGVVDNTANVTTTNDGSGQSSAQTCVAKPEIHIVKTPDAAQVNAGDPIGFTLTVYNTGTGDAKGVTLSDVLPTNAGLSWTIDAEGSGWNNTCAIASGTLTCGPVTVPAGTTQAGSTFTVHITSPTTAATGGTCPGGTGKVDNTGTVTTTNDGSGHSSAETCVAKPSIQIVKTADAPQVSAGSPIGFTLTVYNTGTGDAKGVVLSDTLPTNAGLSWTIDAQGSGWNSTCAIASGTLTCGPVTVPAGTTQAGSTYTVHITSPTTAATGGSCPGSGEVDNTGSVTTTNDGSGQSSAETCVAKPSIQIVKTPDAAQVNAGDPIGFTLTVYNTGAGDAKGVTLSDTLPTNAGLSWTIDAQGSGWNNTCAIASGTLTCGPVTVPAGTTQAGSTFTVHITSPTTAATGGSCPGGSGEVDNTGTVTTTNDGSGQSSAETCVAKPSIQIVKTADAAQVNAGDPIGFTLTVYNAGPGDAKGVVLTDTLPTNPGLSWTIDAEGAGWNSTCAINSGTLTCGPVTVPTGTTLANSTFTVHITSPTTAATGGDCPSTGVVSNTGSVTTTNDGSGQSSASTCVAAPAIHILKTADAPQVNAGDPIGFTLTVWNDGTGDAKGVTLNDILPTNPGLDWTIDAEGSGWNNTCAINNGKLTCGPVTVPFGTTQVGSTFTVHITSTTTADTGGTCPGGSGKVDNTGTVTTTNDGSDHSSAETCVAGATIQILKTADAAQVAAGSQIGFTLVVSNSGNGDANGVTLSDPLPTNAGLAWTIDGQGSGWNGTCAISGGTLTCGGQNGVTVPAGTTPGSSTFTVHIISPTTADTGGLCPDSGVVDNTGTVNSTNAGTAHSEATTCVEGETDLEITKSGSPASQTVTSLPYGNITWTITVTNKGPLADTNVQVGDPMPANNMYVSYTTSIGNVCVGGAILQCSLGTMQPGDVVTITLVTNPTVTGDQVNTANVVGDLAETDYTNNSATATVKVVGVVKPPACTLVRLVKPKQLYAGRLTNLLFKLTLGKTTHPVKGVRVRITGGAGLKGFHLTTRPSSSRGRITAAVQPRTRGILYFKPIVTSPNTACGSKVGVTDVFTPPVTG